jgi:hypothetical protein
MASLARFPTDGSAVLFIAAGKLDRATTVVRAVPQRIRSHCVVVARLDHMADAVGALSLGAADLLVAPLSPQQVTGAFDRIGDPGRAAKDPATGLRILDGATQARFGYPGHAIRVRPSHPEDLLSTVLMLRRYLRGYDSVGVDGNGAAVAVVYCPADHVQAVMQRMPVFLGDRVKLEMIASTSKTARAA